MGVNKTFELDSLLFYSSLSYILIVSFVTGYDFDFDFDFYYFDFESSI